MSGRGIPYLWNRGTGVAELGSLTAEEIVPKRSQSMSNLNRRENHPKGAAHWERWNLTGI